jgi:hypothetical protein
MAEALCLFTAFRLDLASLPKASVFLPVKPKTSQAPVAHTCNLIYLGGRDQED